MFSAVLIANRGEVASRVIRTARSMGIRTVSVTSEVDLGLAFVAEADEVVGLGGSTAAESYLDIHKIIAAARTAKVDAIHPGYGFLAESPEFAEACVAAGLVLVGPSADNIRTMGHKTTAKSIASAAGVPVIPGAVLGEDQLSDEGLRAVGGEVGFPLLVKASAGGGGRGMRLVTQPEDLYSAVVSAGREAEASFGDGTVFLERYLTSARHIELQIVADSHGSVLTLGDRDCSLQRRHQKVIEEAPTPGVSQELRSRMTTAACSLAKKIAYEGVGTVEFMVLGDEFYFLEMNTRLQVEHPVTEEITGLDLVELQFRIASGEKLWFTQDEVRFDGHAIEARLYAEDPRQDFLGSSGRVSCFEWANPDDVRTEQTYFAGDDVSGFYDPLIAKLVVHDESRSQARTLIARELRGLQIHGPTVNRDLLVSLIESPLFDAAVATTDVLEESRELQQIGVGPGDTEVMVVLAIAAGVKPQSSPNLPAAPIRMQAELDHGATHRLRARYISEHDLCCEWDDQSHVVRVLELASDGCRFELEGQLHTYDFCWQDECLWINAYSGQRNVYRGSWLHPPGDASGRSDPVAPVQGTVLDVAVNEGDVVVDDQILVTLEAMKMEHVVRAPRSGTISAVLVEPGEQVAAGSPLVRIAG